MNNYNNKKKYIATAYLEDKLSSNPDTSRFSHCLATLYADQHRIEETHRAYKNALRSSPGDVMIRNDYALFMSKTSKDKQDSVDELNHALLIIEDQPTLHKNLGAIEASRGNYTRAIHCTRRALQLNDRDIVNLRNHAKIQSALGDTRQAFAYNNKAMVIEAAHKIPHPNTQCYRTSAVQNITLGGNHEYSINLVKTARKYENKIFDGFEYVTTHRTNEIVNSIAQRKEHPMHTLERIVKEAEEKKALEYAVKHGDVRSLLKQKFGKY